MVDRFDFHQGVGHMLQRIQVFAQHVEYVGIGFGYGIVHFLVDEFGYTFTVVAFMAQALAEEDLVLLFAEDHGTQFRAHAQAGDHLAGDAGDALQVAGCTAADFVEDDFFGSPAAEGDADLSQVIRLRFIRPVFFGQHHGIAASPAARDDRDFMDRIGIRQEIGDEGMARFVDCRQTLFLIADDMAAAFRTEADFFTGFFQFSHIDDFLIGPGSQEGCFVKQVAQIGTGKARCLLGDDVEIDILAEGLAFGMDVEDSPAAAQIRTVDRDLPVKTTGTQQGRVEDIRTVGRSNGDDAFVGPEAIHFDQELIQRLFPFVVAAAKAGATLTADGVDFVDEDDAGRILLGLSEQITDTGSADADEHFNEVGTTDAEEGHAGFTGYGTGQEGLPGPRRAKEEHPFGYLGANGIILAGVT